MDRAASDQQGKQPPSASKNGGAREGAKPIGMACRACRLRKIRCGGERPRCSYCVKKGYECLLTPHKKRGRPRKDEQRSRASDRAAIRAGGSSGLPQIQAYGGGMRSMTIPEDGIGLDVHQLWRELTGLSGLELPAELSALAAGSATQVRDANPHSIPSVMPAFDLGLGMPDLSQLTAAEPFPAARLPGADDTLLFATNYAFPNYDPREMAELMEAAAAAMAATTRPQDPLAAPQQPTVQLPHSPSGRTDSQASSTHQSFAGDGILGLTAKRPAGASQQRVRKPRPAAEDRGGSEGPSSSLASRARSESTLQGPPIAQTVDEGIRA
ncbi:hypothetical protein LPJ61_006616, partial [Coemansia biformis]